jgi:Zn-dependent protease with chaperone function
VGFEASGVFQPVGCARAAGETNRQTINETMTERAADRNSTMKPAPTNSQRPSALPSVRRADEPSCSISNQGLGNHSPMHSAATPDFVAARLHRGRTWRGAFIALAIAGSAVGSSARAQVFDLERIRSQEVRLAEVALKVGMAAADDCPAVARRPGWTLHNIAQYPASNRVELEASLGMDAYAPSLLALAKSGPAKRAGLRDDDVIVGLKGERWTGATQADEASFAPLRAQLDRLDEAFAAGSVILIVRRNGREFDVPLAGERVCSSRIQLDLSNMLSAEADDRTVTVSIGLAEFADNSELAFVLGHELAHVILRHREQRLKAGSAWTNAGQIAAERAADGLGLRLMARAGYSPAAAADFWTHLAQAHPEASSADSGHPSATDRAAAVRSPSESAPP